MGIVDDYISKREAIFCQEQVLQVHDTVEMLDSGIMCRVRSLIPPILCPELAKDDIGMGKGMAKQFQSLVDLKSKCRLKIRMIEEGYIG